MKQYTGKRVYEGIAIGNIVRYNDTVILNDKISEGYEIELKRFHYARNFIINQYNKLYQELRNNHSAIILSFISIAEDLDLIETVEGFLKYEELNAEQAVQKSCQILKEMLLNLDNEYLKERVNDIEEVCNKIINKLQNTNILEINKEIILVADNLSVSTFLQLDKTKILGLVLENVSPNAHIAILARSLSIPCIASVSEKIIINENDIAILDCTSGKLIVNPKKSEQNNYQLLLEKYNKNKNELFKYKDIEIKTVDNKKMKVYANISSSLEIDSVLDNNADGIGLFRSEYIYINSDTFPLEEEQFNHYKKCALAMGDKATIIRTMDIGADKSVPYFNISKEANPSLGYRGVRLYKEFKDVFMTQLQALLRASYYGNLKIMIPMITNIDEVKYVLSCINEAKQNLIERNIKYNDKMKVGVMIETPAAALICDEIAKYVDFFSIGTNDLTQYVLAIDRENNKVLDTFNPKHKSILKLIYHVSKVAKENNIEVGICGELARSQELLGFYVLCGIDEISVSSSYVLECKKNITKIDTRGINIFEYIN